MTLQVANMQSNGSRAKAMWEPALEMWAKSNSPQEMNLEIIVEKARGKAAEQKWLLTS